jgi:hypothetical protein
VAYYAGRGVYQYSRSLTAALALQGGWLLFQQALLAITRIQNEPLLIMSGLALSIPIVALIFADKMQTKSFLGNSELGLALICGAIVAFGVISKITFAPFALVVFLFLKTARERIAFILMMACTALVLLLPVYPYLPRMATWFTSLALHNGRYGGGEVGLPSAQTMGANVTFLFQSEPLVFLLYPYYAIVLAWSKLSATTGEEGHVAAARRFLFATMIGTLVSLAATIKHPAAHYLIPAIVLATVGATPAVLLLENAARGKGPRNVLIGAGLLLGVWGIYLTCTRMLTWNRSIEEYRRSVFSLERALGGTPGCKVIGFYRSSLPTFALSFGNDYAASMQSEALAKVYPEAINLNIFSGKISRFDGTVQVSDIRRAISNGQCYLMEGTKNLPQDYLKPLSGLSMKPVAEGINEGVYRLELVGEIRPLESVVHFPSDAVIREAEAFDTGTVERETTHWGVGIGVILSPRPPAYAEYHVNLKPGKYELWVRYASGEARPLTIRINGSMLRDDAASEPTSGWDPKDQMWQMVGTTDMSGSNTLRLESGSPFPHVDKIGFVPVHLTESKK